MIDIGTRTKYEQETILLTNEEEKFWNVFTYNSSLKSKLEKYAAEFPELCTLESESSDGSVSYVVQKDRMSINLKKPLSEEAHRQRSERAKAQAANLLRFQGQTSQT